jgi:hypothetical protein
MIRILGSLILLVAAGIQNAGAMIVTTENNGELKSRQLGRSLGEAICNVKVEFTSGEVKFVVGTYIDRAVRPGGLFTVLTSANALVNSIDPQIKIKDIWLNFSETLNQGSSSVRGHSYLIFPRFVEKTNDAAKAGLYPFDFSKNYSEIHKLIPYDLALIQFKAPTDFNVRAMGVGYRPDSLREESYLGPNSRAFFQAGYGLTAPNVPNSQWYRKAEKNDVRRISYTYAHLWENNGVKSFRNYFFVDKPSDSSSSAVIPFTFLVPPEPLYQDEFTAALGRGDIGSPLFAYDGKRNRFRVAGVLSQMLDGWDLASKAYLLVYAWTELGIDQLRWIQNADSQKFTRLKFRRTS